MSINALSNAALARRTDFEPANTVPATLSEIAAAAGTPPRPVQAPPERAGAPVPAPATPTNTALQTLTTYIPTEILTLYVAAVAAIGPLTVDGQPVGRWAPFFVFLAATPILVWVAFATKLRAAGKPLPASPQRWPIWEMIAATLAYLAWTFALPNTPFAQNTVRIGIADGVSGEGLFGRQGSACNASVRRGKETSGRQERRDYLGLSPDRLRDQPMKTQYNFAGGKRGVVNAALREYVGAKREPLEATLRRVLGEELPHDLKRTASR